MKRLAAMNSRFIKLLLVPLFLSLSGCVYLVVGGIGAVGGYIISPDTVEGITQNDVETVWDATVEIVSIMGIVLEQNEGASTLIAKINGAKVTISALTLNSTSVKLTIKSRRYGFPNIGTAQDVFVKLMSYLNE